MDKIWKTFTGGIHSISKAIGGGASSGVIDALLPELGDEIKTNLGTANDTMNKAQSTMGGAQETMGVAQQTMSGAQDTMGVAKQTMGTVDWCLKCTNIVMGFTGAIGAACTIYKTIDNAKANKHLVGLGKTISDDVKGLSEREDILIALEEPLFGEHVYKFVKNSINQSSTATGQQEYFFVYHPGTNWHPEFHTLVAQEPLPAGFCGVTHEFEVLAIFLYYFRQTVGPDAVINILVPSAHVYVMPEELTIPEALQPFRILGELGHAAQPKVYITMSEAWKDSVSHVGLLPPPTPPPSPPEIEAEPAEIASEAEPARVANKTSTAGRILAHSAGAAAGAAGAAGGWVAGVVPGALLGPAGAVLGGAAAAGPAGYKAGTAARDKVRQMVG